MRSKSFKNRMQAQICFFPEGIVPKMQALLLILLFFAISLSGITFSFYPAVHTPVYNHARIFLRPALFYCSGDIFCRSQRLLFDTTKERPAGALLLYSLFCCSINAFIIAVICAA